MMPGESPTWRLVAYVVGAILLFNVLVGGVLAFNARDSGSGARVTAASGPTTGLAFRHVHDRHLRLCGDYPVTGVTWTPGRAHQRFQRCTIRAHFTITTPGPTRTALTSTPLPRPTYAWPTPWPTPRPTAIPSGCSDSNLDACLLSLLNSERASHGLPPLILDTTMSNGTATCIGAIGHARNMAAAGTIGHGDFPQDVCGYGSRFFHVGENVGVGVGGSPLADVELVHQQMLAEPYSPGCTGSHHCQIDDPRMRYVGLGIVAGSYLGRPAEYISEEYGG